MTNPEKLTRLMKKHDWTEAKVAEMLGFKPNNQRHPGGHHRTVHEWLLGNRDPAMSWDHVFTLIENKLKKR